MDEQKLDSLVFAMSDYYAGMPSYVQHFLKVREFAAVIGRAERLDAPTQFILEAAALTHDIGIKPSLEKYGSADGQYQQIEGVAPAIEMLGALGFSREVTERVCHLIAHHHSYTDIDGADYQILVEADFLVNAFEGEMTPAVRQRVYDNIFKTEAGKRLFKTLYLS